MGRLQGRGLPPRIGKPISGRLSSSSTPGRAPAPKTKIAQHPFAGRAGSKIRDRFAADLFVRQSGACKMCGKLVDASLRGTTSARAAVVDHLTPWRLDPDRAFDIENLVLVCRQCHATCDSIEKRLWPDAVAIAAEKQAIADRAGRQ